MIVLSRCGFGFLPVCLLDGWGFGCSVVGGVGLLGCGLDAGAGDRIGRCVHRVAGS